MSVNAQKIRFLRRHIPVFECEPGCHECCGPVTASGEEMARLPIKSDQVHADALMSLSCPYLGEQGCQVYAERPLVCRLFGSTPKLACPNGKRPKKMIDSRVEQKIYTYFAENRHVLV